MAIKSSRLLKTGAQAIHPAMAFSRKRLNLPQCVDAGIVFIGPNPRAIEAMGDKIEVKKFAEGRQGFGRCQVSRRDRELGHAPNL